MTLSCKAARAALIDPPENEALSDALARHLAGCPDCRRLQEDQAFVRQVLAQAAWPAAPQEAWRAAPREAGLGHRPDPVPDPAPRHAARSSTRLSPPWIGRLRDLALLGTIAAVMVLLLARGWGGDGDRPSAGEGGTPTAVFGVAGTPGMSPQATGDVAVRATAGSGDSARPVAPNGLGAADLPAWVREADPRSIVVVPVPDESRLLTGYDLLIDQELDFTWSPLWTQADDAACQELWLDWDDGQAEQLACLPPAEVSTEAETFSRHPLKHRYQRAGAYRPRLWMRQVDEKVLTGPVADFRVLDRHVSLGVPAGTGPSDQGVVADDPSLKTQLVVLIGLWALLLWMWIAPSRAPAWLKRLPGWLLVCLLVATLLSIPLRRAASIPRYQIEPWLGRVGLDPLRPDAALVRVERQFSLGSWLRGRGRLRLLFADGGSSIAEPPLPRMSRLLYGHFDTAFGPVISRHEDALGRLRAVHAPVGLPFADLARDGIGLAIPERLPLSVDARRHLDLDAAWYRAGCVAQGNLIPAPDEGTVIIPRPELGTRLYAIDLATGALASTRPTVRDVAWSPDSRWLVTLGGGGRRPEDSPAPLAVLSVLDRETLSPRASTEIEASSVLSTASDGIWFAQGDGVWRMPWPGGARSADRSKPQVGSKEPLLGDSLPSRVFAWPEILAYQPSADRRWIAVAPGSQRLAYACRGGACIVDLQGRPIAVVGPENSDRAIRDAFWRDDGQRLVLIEATVKATGPAGDAGYPFNWHPLKLSSQYPWQFPEDVKPGDSLRILTADGQQLHSVSIPAAGSTASPPRWTADGRWLIFTSCPLDGRRIIAVDAERGAAVDLSQPGWDAWAVLMPQSGDLLLHNGRGGLWRAAVVLGGEGR